MRTIFRVPGYLEVKTIQSSATLAQLLGPVAFVRQNYDLFILGLNEATNDGDESSLVFVIPRLYRVID